MKKISKALISVLLLNLCCFNSVYAASNDGQATSLSGKEAKEILINYGISQEMTEALGKNDVTSIANKIMNEPEKINYESDVTIINEYINLQEIVNTTDAELTEKYQMKEEDIKNIRDEIDNMKLLSNDKISQIYNKNNDEATLIKDIIKGNVKDEAALDAMMASISADDNWIKTELLNENNSTSTATNYRFHYKFTWNNPPLITAFTDSVAFAWGGDLTLSSRASNIRYENNVGTAVNGSASYKETAVNAGGVFDFVQSRYAGVSHNDPTTFYKLKYGLISFSVSQNGRNNPLKSTKLIAQYAHMQFAVTGDVQGSMDGLTPNIAIGFGYDESSQLEQIIYR